MKTRILSVLGLAAVLVATPAFALTVEDVIGLTRAGASDAVIMAKIDADGTVFRLTVDEILELKSAGVSDAVITYMINSGKLELEEVAPQVSTPAQDEVQSQPAETGSYDDGGDFGMSVGVSNYGFGVSFGYYYPHWPGYSYGWYYDPFYWTSWPYYYCYWAPYPYYWWYYDPWYACYPYPHHYYDGWYDYHYPGHDYKRVDKGRNVGSRGPVDHADRVIKEPGSPEQDAARVERSRQTVRLRQPKPGVGSSDSAPTVIRGKVRSTDPGPGRTVTLKPTDRTRLRSQPARVPVGQQRRNDYRGTKRQDSPKVDSSGGGGSSDGDVKSSGKSGSRSDKPSSGSRDGGRSFGSGSGRSKPSSDARPSPSPSRGGSSSGPRSRKGG